MLSTWLIFFCIFSPFLFWPTVKLQDHAGSEILRSWRTDVHFGRGWYWRTKTNLYVAHLRVKHDSKPKSKKRNHRICLTCLYWNRFLLSSHFFYLNIGYHVYDNSGGKKHFCTPCTCNIFYYHSQVSKCNFFYCLNHIGPEWFSKIMFHTAHPGARTRISLHLGFYFFFLSINQEKSFAFVYL